MEPMLEGLTVVELVEWAFVPSAGAVLADWGADVVKIEHPIRGDALRGLMLPGGANDFHHRLGRDQPAEEREGDRLIDQGQA